MPILPESEAVQLLEGLNALSKAERHNSFILRRYKKQADSIRQVKPFDGFLLLGAIATLEGNLEEMHYFYKCALKLHPSDPVGFHNYAISLNKLGFYAEAFHYAKQAYEQDRSYLSSLDALMHITLMLGRIHQVFALLQEWDKMTHQSPSTVSLNTLKKALSIMDKHNIIDEDVEKVQTIASSCLQRENTYIDQVDFQVVSTATDQWIEYEYWLDEVSPVQLVELEDTLAEQLGQFPREITKVINVKYTSDNPELDEFLDYMENHIQKHPEDKLEVSQEERRQLEELLGL